MSWSPFVRYGVGMHLLFGGTCDGARNNFFSPEEIAAIVKDYRNAGLAPDEVAVMSLAQKIIRKAHQVSEADFEELRGLGLSDAEIFDVVLACTARSFFSKTLDATGAVPDEAYQELGPEIVESYNAWAVNFR